MIQGRDLLPSGLAGEPQQPQWPGLQLDRLWQDPAWQPAVGAPARSLVRAGILVQELGLGRWDRRALSCSVDRLPWWLESVDKWFVLAWLGPCLPSGAAWEPLSMAGPGGQDC